MAANLKVQNFRANDLANDSGKQFELGRSWCVDFFQIDDSLREFTVDLIFKPLISSQQAFQDKIIKLKLSEVTRRGDRKAYANGEFGQSQIKEFFINKLGLNEDNLEDYFAIYKTPFNEYYLYFVPKLLYNNFIQLFKSAVQEVSVESIYRNSSQNSSYSLQQIFYGAPGTGKSHEIKELTKTANDEGRVIRTTFHPDSDYSTFVGAYKPTMKPTGVTYTSGVKEEVIKYTFVPQAFAKAYTSAWNTEEDIYLIIEEINRGNCAQIFGDLFQLLDRKQGISEYPVDSDTDLGDYIKGVLKDSTRTDFPEGVKEGKKLVLPSNLYIWATMNTSDQSLFPIDSAFKRRWDWKYIPIKKHDEGYKIEIGDVTYDWWKFLEKINQVIDNTTSSEDKKLGYFFVKADNKVVDAQKFVSKVLFYLWNDVFKNYGFDNPIFSKGGNLKFAFSDFFQKDGTPDKEIVNQFLKKLDETIDKDNSFIEISNQEADNSQSEAAE